MHAGMGLTQKEGLALHSNVTAYVVKALLSSKAGLSVQPWR
jgi:hypothetical protein